MTVLDQRNKLKILMRCSYCGKKSDEVKFIKDVHGIKRRTCPNCELHT